MIDWTALLHEERNDEVYPMKSIDGGGVDEVEEAFVVVLPGKFFLRLNTLGIPEWGSQ